MSVIKKLNSEAIVAFHVAYAKLPGSDPLCALFLSQVSYWCARSEGGVAWITHQAMYNQTGMSRKQQDRAAAYWASQGVLEKFIKGIPPKIHYFVDFDKLEKLLLDAEFQQNDMSERDNLDVRKGQQVLSERGKTSREDSKDSLETHSSLAPLAPSVPADEQQPERSEFTSPSASTPGLTSEPSHATPVLPVRQARAKKTSTAPAIPSLEDFVAWAKEKHPGWEREAEAWHKRMESQDWVNGSGRRILNAKGTFNTWLANGWIKKVGPGWGVPSSTGQALSPLERQAREAEQAKNYVPML